jgi:hypothetical protein
MTYTELSKPVGVVHGSIDSLTGTIGELTGTISELGHGADIYVETTKPATEYEAVGGLLWSENYYPWKATSYPWLKKGGNTTNYMEITKP